MISALHPRGATFDVYLALLSLSPLSSLPLIRSLIERSAAALNSQYYKRESVRKVRDTRENANVAVAVAVSGSSLEELVRVRAEEQFEATREQFIMHAQLAAQDRAEGRAAHSQVSQRCDLETVAHGHHGTVRCGQNVSCHCAHARVTVA